MTRPPDPGRIRRARLRAQRLAPPERDGAGVAEVVGAVVGLPAQDEPAATLGIRARSRGPTARDVEAAMADATVIRTWCMRGTLHLVASEDLPSLLSAFGPVFVSRGRRRLDELGFDPATADDAVGAIREALARDGPLTRAGISEALLAAGFEFDPAGQAPYHLIRRAGLVGEVCQVAPVDGDVAYGLVDEWVSPPEPPDRRTALGELAGRYLAGYGPASIADFASWSGLPMTDVRDGWEQAAEATGVTEIGGDPPLLARRELDDVDAPAPLRLLPAYDAYLLGYDGRDHAVAGAHARRVHPGGGIVRPTAIDDGRAVATWSIDRSGPRPSLAVNPFEPPTDGLRASLRREADDVGRFLGLDVELSVEP